MTPVLSTTAWVLHDLSLATGFGGSLYGKAALAPAVRTISSAREREAVTAHAWKDFSVFNAISLATIAGTWIAGRSALTGREIDGTTRALVIAKDLLVGTAVATGVGAMVTGALHDRKDAAPSRLLATPDARAALKTTSSTLGYVNLAAIAGIIGVTAVLAMKAGSSHRFSFLSRFLP